VNAILAGLSGLLEKRIFGGIGYLLNGNMACGVHKKCLIVRVGPDRYQAALQQDHMKIFDITGRPMTGRVMVSAEGVADEQNLKQWVQQGVEFASTLPPK